IILHVRRHYIPHDSVVTWRNGRLVLIPPSPGAQSEPGLVIYRFGVGVFYANATRLSDEVMELVDGPEPPRWFVLQADAIDDLDSTGGRTLAELVDELGERGIVVAVADATAPLRAELDRFGITEKIGREHVYDTLQAARDAYHASAGGQE